ncbi:hypothetical protein NBRC116586_34290 [Pseudooceanicola nitratireducens]
MHLPAIVAKLGHAPAACIYLDPAKKAAINAAFSKISILMRDQRKRDRIFCGAEFAIDRDCVASCCCT